MQAEKILPQPLLLINFSHPIPNSDTSVARITGSECRVVDIPIQVDLNAAKLSPQVEAIVDEAVATAGDNIDFIRLPGHADVAAMVINEFQARGHAPDILRLASVQGATPPRFEAVEIVRLKQSQKEVNWSTQWTKFTWALELIHGQTPRDLFDAYQIASNEASE